MEIVKAFVENGLHIELVIKGTPTEPLFRASDIGVILEIKNINQNISHFDKSEKVISLTYTLGGNQQVTFLTEKGLYKVLFKSRKQIAEKFQNWVCEIIKEVRLTGEYKLNKEVQELQEQNQELKQNIIQIKEKSESDIIQIKEQSESESIQLKEQTDSEKYKFFEKTLIDKFPINTECIYIGTIDDTNDSNETLIKFGRSNDISKRITNHKNTYKNFKLINVFKVNNYVEIEKIIKSSPKFSKYKRELKINGHNYVELLAYNTKSFSISKIEFYIDEIIKSKQCSQENFNKLEKQIELLEEELRNKDDYKKKYEQEYLLNIELTKTINNKISRIQFLENEENYEVENILLPKDELHEKFNKFIQECCIVRPDVQEIACEIEAQYRIWARVKATKTINHAFKNYLDTRFKPSKESRKIFIGVMLKPIKYTQKLINSDPERFLFNCCVFSPNNRILDSKLFDEYKKWKIMINRPILENEMKELKEYLNNSEYFLRASIWTDKPDLNLENKGNSGYYGLCLKTDTPHIHKVMVTTGKRVEKREITTNTPIQTWKSIKDAAISENISPATMSRNISNNVMFTENNWYFCCVK